ncbi:MAG: hypothetical protein K0R63_1735 [Rickettsiales bacterium]|jgi:hypothetical protein|nr:hypothetical protein [Rickettsiales bacterium]
MKKQILRSLLLILFLICTTSACSTSKLTGMGGIAGMPKAPTEGPKEYIAGWEDGCETGMTAYSNDFYRSKMSVKVNGPMMYNAHYNKGWTAGNRYCTYYTSSYLSGGMIDRGYGDDLRDKDTWIDEKPYRSALFSGWKFPFHEDDLSVREASFDPFGGSTDPFYGQTANVLAF